MVLKARSNKLEVESFSFGSLSPGFGPDKNASTYKLESLNDVSAFKNKITDKTIRTERDAEAKSGFSIDKTVRELRGLTKQEANDIEKAVAREVENRLQKLQAEAEKRGFEAGHQEGQAKAYAEAVEKYDALVNEFAQWLEEARGQLDTILMKGQQDAYHMIKNLVKWIILKEVNDKDYISRLLEKLILEMNSKNNLVIRVNGSAFSEMEEVLNLVQSKVGTLTNTRVETHLDLDKPGIVLESENGIVDGSLEAQFSSLDKIFEVVMKNNEA